jgi:hypothetical protein
MVELMIFDDSYTLRHCVREDCPACLEQKGPDDRHEMKVIGESPRKVEYEVGI